jgi:putative hemolysin
MKDLPMPALPLQGIASRSRRARGSLQQLGEDATADPGPIRLEVAWAREEGDVREAQRLRHLVFAEEMGARLSPTPGTPLGLDADVYDPYCEHLLVRASALGNRAGTVIGTYRVLTPTAARRVGGFCSEAEFDLTRLRPLRDKTAELSRCCVHPDHRHGGANLALWGALTEFMACNNLDTMLGCASVSMRDGGRMAASLWRQLRHTHLAPIEWQVRPRLPLPVDDLARGNPVDLPALIKGYLRCGARILSAPGWDPDFNTADLPMIMRLTELPHRFRRQFLGR